MSTSAGTIRSTARPAGFTLWTAAVSALAAAALIMSALALTVAGRDQVVTGVAGAGTFEAAGTEGLQWDAVKLEAMQGRALAELVRNEGVVTWDAAKLEAMRGRMLAAGILIEGPAAGWDAGKLEAMEGRVRAG
jgi:hypothetical protein